MISELTCLKSDASLLILIIKTKDSARLATIVSVANILSIDLVI